MATLLALSASQFAGNGQLRTHHTPGLQFRLPSPENPKAEEKRPVASDRLVSEPAPADESLSPPPGGSWSCRPLGLGGPVLPAHLLMSTMASRPEAQQPVLSLLLQGPQVWFPSTRPGTAVQYAALTCQPVGPAEPKTQ